MKEQSRLQAQGSIIIMVMSIPDSRDSLDKKPEKSRRTDELVTAERNDQEAWIAATGGVKAGNTTSGPREEKQHCAVLGTSNTQVGWRRS